MSEFQLGSEERPLRVAVVGSGPSGFYAINALYKQKDLHVDVDLFDRLPTPYGLVRGGVAPDHQRIKNVIKQYQKIAAKRDGFRFLGNVKLGRDIGVDDLTRHFDCIVYATGNETDRKMGVEGEDLAGVHSATEFVGWFNGHPDFQDRTFDLTKAKRVAVVGNGNVAMDVARIMARSIEVLAESDITDAALEALKVSNVTDILLLGRRGPAQAAFSPKEIKELANTETADLVVLAEQMQLDALSASWLEEKGDRDAKKNVAFLTEHVEAGQGERDRKIRCEFLVSPVAFVPVGGDAQPGGDAGQLGAIRLERNELYEDNRGTPRPRGTGNIREEKVDLVFKAIGYRGEPIPGVPFHERWGCINNVDGRVVNVATEKPVPFQYVVGWAKRGPSGLIGTNSADSAKTVALLLEDIEGVTARADDEAKTADAVDGLLAAKAGRVVTFADWEKLDGLEVERGQAKGKVREKFTNIDDMLAALD